MGKHTARKLNKNKDKRKKETSSKQGARNGIMVKLSRRRATPANLEVAPRLESGRAATVEFSHGEEPGL